MKCTSLPLPKPNYNEEKVPNFSLESGAVEIIFIRHADAHPESNVHANSLHDLPLSSKGNQQAALLASRLATQRIDAIIASPLQRTKQTAQAIATGAQRSITYDDRLREVQIGDGSISYDLAELAQIAIKYGGWSHLPGAESSTSIRTRVCMAIDDLVASYAGSRIAVVSHAGTINAYFASVLGLKRDFFFPAGNTSISTFRAHEDLRMIVTLNDTAHLRTGVQRGA